MNSQTVYIFLEWKVFQLTILTMDGFHLVFFTENWKLNENSKDLDDRDIFCKNSYHTSEDECSPTLLYETNKVADQPTYRTFLSEPLFLNILSRLIWAQPVC